MAEWTWQRAQDIDSASELPDSNSIDLSNSIHGDNVTDLNSTNTFLSDTPKGPISMLGTLQCPIQDGASNDHIYFNMSSVCSIGLISGELAVSNHPGCYFELFVRFFVQFLSSSCSVAVPTVWLGVHCHRVCHCHGEYLVFKVVRVGGAC